jgi:hypothetical protein
LIIQHQRSGCVSIAHVSFPSSPFAERRKDHQEARYKARKADSLLPEIMKGMLRIEYLVKAQTMRKNTYQLPNQANRAGGIRIRFHALLRLRARSLASVRNVEIAEDSVYSFNLEYPMLLGCTAEAWIFALCVTMRKLRWNVRMGPDLSQKTGHLAPST